MRASKGFSPSQSNEHLRCLSDCERAQKARWNYDPSREHLNFEIGKGGVVTEVNKSKTINQRIKENLDSRGIVNPNKKLIDQGLDPKYRTVANFILGGNREVMRNLAFGNQRWIGNMEPTILPWNACQKLKHGQKMLMPSCVKIWRTKYSCFCRSSGRSKPARTLYGFASYREKQVLFQKDIYERL